MLIEGGGRIDSICPAADFEVGEEAISPSTYVSSEGSYQQQQQETARGLSSGRSCGAGEDPDHCARLLGSSGGNNSKANDLDQQATTAGTMECYGTDLEALLIMMHQQAPAAGDDAAVGLMGQSTMARAAVTQKPEGVIRSALPPPSTPLEEALVTQMELQKMLYANLEVGPPPIDPPVLCFSPFIRMIAFYMSSAGMSCTVNRCILTNPHDSDFARLFDC